MALLEVPTSIPPLPNLFISKITAGICEVIAGIAGMISKDIALQKVFPLLLELVEDTVPEVKIT